MSASDPTLAARSIATCSREFMKIFVVTALGFPVLVFIIDLVDNLPKYLGRSIPSADAAAELRVLAAGARCSTCCRRRCCSRRCSRSAPSRGTPRSRPRRRAGISFYRFILPIVCGALLATALGLGLGEIAPRREREAASRLLKETKDPAATCARELRLRGARAGGSTRRSCSSWTRAAHALVEIERKGNGAGLPGHDPRRERRPLPPRAQRRSGRVDARARARCTCCRPTRSMLAFAFDSVLDRRMHRASARPACSRRRRPEDMDYARARRVHPAHGALRRRRERAAGRAHAQDRDPGDVRDHPALRRAARHEHAARRRGVRRRTEPRHDDRLPRADPAHARDRRQGARSQPELAAWIPSAIFGVAGSVLLRANEDLSPARRWRYGVAIRR